MHATYSKIAQEPFDPKKYEKHALKYVRSNKDIVKNDSFSHNQYKKYGETSSHIKSEN